MFGVLAAMTFPELPIELTRTGASSDSGSGGTLTWSNTGNALEEDGNQAAAGGAPGLVSHWLRIVHELTTGQIGEEFDDYIPTLELRIKRRGLGAVSDHQVLLEGGANHAKEGNWPEPLTWETYEIPAEGRTIADLREIASKVSFITGGGGGSGNVDVAELHLVGAEPPEPAAPDLTQEHLVAIIRQQQFI